MKFFLLILIIIILSATFSFAQDTKPAIDDLKNIQPQADSFSDKKILGGIEYFEAMKDKNLIGYCINVTTNGYCGPIRMIVGIDKEGVIQGMKILQHTETADIGARIAEPSFSRQFTGKKADDLIIGKNIDAITGATISSKVVIDSINDTAKKFISLLPAHQAKLKEKQ